MTLKHSLLAIPICLLILTLFTGNAFGRMRNHNRIMHTTATATVTPTQVATPSATPQQGIDLLTGQWSYMPGMDKTADGFVIRPLGIAIVNQDGSFSQYNPPINLVGTHLENVTGDFAITTTLKPQTSQTATIELYGKTPIIADEFRVERASLKMLLSNGKLTVNSKTFTFTPQDTLALTVTRKAKTLSFSINNAQVGSISDTGIFSSGQIWFGFDSTGSNWLLSGLSFTSLPASPSDSSKLFDASQLAITQHDPNGLQALATKKRPGFIVGAAQALGPLVSDPQYAKIAMDNSVLGSWTPENLMKMINLQPQKGVYTFEQADGFIKLAKQNGISIHGHTLVFAEANPPWFNQLPVQTAADKQVIENVMLDHITKVVGHFKGQINSWDVINEPMADYDDTADGEGAELRNHKWYQAMGQSYISKALIAAHNADPNATLFINEYGLESDGNRWDAFVTLLQQVKLQVAAEGVPTDKLGVGFQAHVYEAGDRIDAGTLRNHIKQLEQLGFKAQISEMDVYSEGGDTNQGQEYAKVFNACISEPNCIAWRGWILSDRYDYFKDDDGSVQTGQDGLFGSDMQPRPGFTAIQNLLK